MASPAIKNIHQEVSSHVNEDEKTPMSPEQAIQALQNAQNNLIDQFSDLEHVKSARQSLGDLIVKDILIVSSALFWPSVIYWLW